MQRYKCLLLNINTPLLNVFLTQGHTGIMMAPNMATTPLPTTVDYRKLSKDDATISGVVQIEDLGRIKEYLSESAGEVNVTLTFGRDQEWRPTIQGKVSSTLSMLCQRCLDSTQIFVEGEVDLAIVLNDEQAKLLPSHYSPFLVANDLIQLLPLVEDELILSLPMFANHDEGDCQIETSEANEAIAAVIEQSSGEKVNPFSVLAGLKADK
jgi:uncharacterized protein